MPRAPGRYAGLEEEDAGFAEKLAGGIEVDREEEDEEEEEDGEGGGGYEKERAAVVIQSRVRGMQTRSKTPNARGERNAEFAEAEEGEVEEDRSLRTRDNVAGRSLGEVERIVAENSAAVLIQVRGYGLCREIVF